MRVATLLDAVEAYQGVPLRQQQLARFLLGKAASRIEAARGTVRVQLAVSFAAEACAEAVRFINDVVGTSSMRLAQPFERHFRDLHVLMQHSDKSSQRYASRAGSC